MYLNEAMIQNHAVYSWTLSYDIRILFNRSMLLRQPHQKNLQRSAILTNVRVTSTPTTRPIFPTLIVNHFKNNYVETNDQHHNS